MSAPDKEPQPLGSTSGKRGYIRTCVRCGVTLYGVGRRAKYCPECRADVNREIVMDYRTRNPEKVRAAYERRKAATRAAAKAQVGEDRLRLLSNVADWAGITYGKLMLKSQAEREVLILDYKAAKGGTP